MTNIDPQAPTEAMKLAITVDEQGVTDHLKTVVRRTVEETLNAMLDAEADALCGAKRYERSIDRVDTRAGHYERSLETTAGPVTLQVPKLRTLPFETQIIERYRRRETSVEEALVEMYLAGVSVRRVEDVTEALWGTRVSASTVSELNQKIYVQIEAWRNLPILGSHGYVYLEVADMLKAIHAQEDAEAARQKGQDVAMKLEGMRLSKAAEIVRLGIDETITYMAFPREHWRRIKTNNPIERMNREIRRRTRVVGNFPDGHSALMLVCARLRHMSGTKWGQKRYLDMHLLITLDTMAVTA